MTQIAKYPALAAAALAVALAGCHHDATPDQSQAKQAQATPPPEKPAETAKTDAGAGAKDPKAEGQAALDEALKQLQNVAVFFEYDSATLSKPAEEKLANVAAVLAKYPELRVRVEGNCDERGSQQYNLALGQRRAEAARKYLLNLDVKPKQIEAISFGSEKPKVNGHDEDAWRQNRRDDVNPLAASNNK